MAKFSNFAAAPNIYTPVPETAPLANSKQDFKARFPPVRFYSREAWNSFANNKVVFDAFVAKHSEPEVAGRRIKYQHIWFLEEEDGMFISKEKCSSIRSDAKAIWKDWHRVLGDEGMPSTWGEVGMELKSIYSNKLSARHPCLLLSENLWKADLLGQNYYPDIMKKIRSSTNVKREGSCGPDERKKRQKVEREPLTEPSVRTPGSPHSASSGFGSPSAFADALAPPAPSAALASPSAQVNAGSIPTISLTLASSSPLQVRDSAASNAPLEDNDSMAAVVPGNAHVNVAMIRNPL